MKNIIASVFTMASLFGLFAAASAVQNEQPFIWIVWFTGSVILARRAFKIWDELDQNRELN
jgi:hypothetical protein